MDEPTRKLAEDLRNISLEDLAIFRADKLEGSLPVILADKEFERRARLEQHKLDLDLVFEQVRWMKFTAILASVTTLLGAIVGAILTFWLQKNPPIKQSQLPTRSSQQETGASTSVHGIEKAVSVPHQPPLKDTP